LPEVIEGSMRIVVLGSGSRGNAVVVESGSRRILLDAGFSCRALERRMTDQGIDPTGFEAVVLTHEHSDHVRGVERFCRRHGLPVYATEGTLEETSLSPETRRCAVTLRSGEPCEVGGFEVEPFAVPHDAREPVGLVVEDSGGHRLGLVADLGSRSRLAWGRLRDLEFLLLETNHDLEMLRNGPYPWVLKQRVAGRHGHLSNHDAAEGLPELITDRLRWVVLYHLSQTNNLPALAATAVGERLESESCPARVALTHQDEPTAWLDLSMDLTEVMT
jgi:phosphoribosyl 1,2-cyclic phosphodiesterase